MSLAFMYDNSIQFVFHPSMIFFPNAKSAYVVYVPYVQHKLDLGSHWIAFLRSFCLTFFRIRFNFHFLLLILLISVYIRLSNLAGKEYLCVYVVHYAQYIGQAHNIQYELWYTVYRECIIIIHNMDNMQHAVCSICTISIMYYTTTIKYMHKCGNNR